MAISGISAVIDRLRDDTSFRSSYRSDPDVALSTYGLSGEEARALKTGDGLHLEMMGLGEKWADFVETVCGPHPGP